MKAMVLRQFGPVEHNPLTLEEIKNPLPGPGDILIRIRVCGVCHTDLHTVEGELPEVLLPIIPGHQVVGLVEKTGEKVRRFKAGARVGVAWLYSTEEDCKYAQAAGREPGSDLDRKLRRRSPGEDGQCRQFHSRWTNGLGRHALTE